MSKAAPPALQEETRDQIGRFRKGVSGNPGGRPPDPVRQMILPHRAELVEKCITLALEGEMTAMGLLMNRIAPAAKPETPPVVIEGLKEARGPAAKADAILNAAAEGLVSPDTATALLSALAHYCKAQETDVIEARLAALEARGLV